MPGCLRPSFLSSQNRLALVATSKASTGQTRGVNESFTSLHKIEQVGTTLVNLHEVLRAQGL